METRPFPGIRPHPGDQATHLGDRATHPWECAFQCPSLAELASGARSFAGDTEGCCEGQAWHRRAATGDLVALGRAGAPPGTLKPR